MRPVLSILGEVNHLFDSIKSTLIVLGPPPPPKLKYISEKLHD